MMKFFFIFPLLALAYASPPSVIIVGAGMSGISAAKTLHNNNITDFIILEATGRIGGRVHKTKFGGHTVEKGANWLHGVGGPLKNPIFEIAKKINLKNYFSDFSNVSLNTYKKEGGLFSKEEVDAALEMAKSTEKYGTKLSIWLSVESGDDDMSLLAAQRLNKREPKTPLEKMIDFYSFEGEQAEEPRVTSLKHIIPRPESTLYGEDEYFVADSRGFESVIHDIAQTCLSYSNHKVTDSRVIFNQVVREVDYSKKGLVIIKTEDGKVYTAKKVILSPSIGVLQSDLITFRPVLPFWKRRSINEFSIGAYTKIFLKFPKRFWPNGKGTEFFFYVHDRRGYYAIWKHLDNEYPGSNILFVTAADDELRRIEQQSDEETKAEAMEVLRKIFGTNIPDATDILIPRWYSDRLFRGAFTNWPFGYTQERHNQLRAPVRNRLYFTGEHTHAELFGYVDGAYFAGANTANDVVNCLKKGRCKGRRIQLPPPTISI